VEVGREPVRVIELHPVCWLDVACRVARRNLSFEEWTTNIGDLERYRITCPEFPAHPVDASVAALVAG
jgi:hypothetical protein